MRTLAEFHVTYSLEGTDISTRHIHTHNLATALDDTGSAHSTYGGGTDPDIGAEVVEDIS